MNMTFHRYLMIVSSCAFAFSCSTQAAQIYLIHEGSPATGTLNGIPFNTEFIFHGIADTDDRLSFSNGFWLEHSSATVELVGIGTYDFVTGTRTYVNNQNSVVGFSRSVTTSSGLDLFSGPDDPLFDTWDLNTEIGPVSGLGRLIQWTNSDVVTSGGVLIFDSAFTDVTFTAFIPEPASGLLLWVGCLAICTMRRNK